MDELDHEGEELPYNLELHGRVLMDMSLPLIPGCFIPLMDGRVTWIYLRCEGVFKFCKSCGCVGHLTSRCIVDPRIAARNIRRRLEAVEEDGFRVLHGPTNYPFYTNFIEGLPDRFRYRNTSLDLLRYEEPEDVPFNERF